VNEKKSTDQVIFEAKEAIVAIRPLLTPLNVGNFDRFRIPLIRRLYPRLIVPDEPSQKQRGVSREPKDWQHEGF
jgi:hypothetical protein